MSIHCLLIEDDAFTRDVFSLTLRRAKMYVELAPSGEEAIAYLQKNIPDVIIVDLHLPNISGYDIINMIRSDVDLQHIHIIIVTANPSAIRTPEARLADAFLTKPVNIQDLVNTIEHLVSVGHS